ncbi:adenosylmethionine--8-amino-7-oxononanoate transaminase [Candidatus Ruminimicrobiellum ovillum]|uniref:adenosylmethionine--8-amino-7-oxononanoate transaminase n=1 Tax=Candidatus Ruminimicrobiellum ovillum TaxID=1947927 RepID=UPI00355A75AB
MFKDKSLEQKDLKYIWHPCSQMKDYETLLPMIIDHAKGLYLYDIYGKKYADVISSWWCNLLGHCNPRINKAVSNQLKKLEHVIFANFSNKSAIDLSEKLISVAPKGLSKVFFTDNGSSAVESALKMSFQYHYQTGNPQKKKFMAISDAYHGETVGALSVGGVDLYSKIFQPLLIDILRVQGPDCYRCPFNKDRKSCNAECFCYAEKVLEKQHKNIAAFIIEPMLQGSAGMRIYSPNYLKKLRKVCTKYNIHLIADEIASGYGRTGKMFACNHADITPDIMCVGKGLTGGYLPMALTLTNNKIYKAFYADYNKGKMFIHSHTFSGNPLASAAALEVLNILKDEKIIEKAQKKAVFFNNLIKETFSQNKFVGDIRSIGLINAIELVKDKKTKQPLDSKKRTGYQIYKQALKLGLLLRPLGDIMYFNPPLTITEKEMKQVVKLCKQAFINTGIN